jgi:hypothetical protein
VGALATSRSARARDAAVIVALIAAAVASTRLLAPPPREIAAAALGLLVGWGLRRFFVARAATTRPDSARHRFEGAVDALEAKRAE